MRAIWFEVLNNTTNFQALGSVTDELTQFQMIAHNMTFCRFFRKR